MTDPTHAFPDLRCARIDQLVTHWVGLRPEAPALAEAGRVLSYRALEDQVAACAGFLGDQGVSGGDRVLILLENGLAAAVLMLAASRIGAWPIPLNARLSAREVNAIRDHASPRVTLYTSGSSPDARAHGERDGAIPLPAELSLDATYRSEPGKAAARRPEPERGAGRDRVAALIYTSGTTGAPKGVLLSHGNLLFVAERTSQTRPHGEDDRVYLVLPISHVYGLGSVLVGNLYRGVRVDLVARFAPEAVAQALAEDDITAFHGVPAMYSQLISLARRRGGKLAAPKLRYCSIGGAPVDLALKRDSEALLGVPLCNGYGLTETSPTISVNLNEAPGDDDSVGSLLPDVELRIVGKEGRDLAEGEIGEVWVRGGMVMQGYYRDPARTDEVLTADGWLKTGDLGRVDGDGRLFIAGRSKDLIIRSGFNVYPVEVEGVIASHPAVALTAVLGCPAKAGEEEIVAFVEPRPGTEIDLDALAAFVAENLAAYKRPARYILREALPVTAAGKVLRHRLKESLHAGKGELP